MVRIFKDHRKWVILVFVAILATLNMLFFKFNTNLSSCWENVAILFGASTYRDMMIARPASSNRSKSCQLTPDRENISRYHTDFNYSREEDLKKGGIDKCLGNLDIDPLVSSNTKERIRELQRKAR